MCVHALTPREKRERSESGMFLKSWKNTIFNEHPVHYFYDAFKSHLLLGVLPPVSQLGEKINFFAALVAKKIIPNDQSVCLAEQ